MNLIKNRLFCLLSTASLAMSALPILSQASTVDGCSFFKTCQDTSTGFEFPDGISETVCTNGGGCVDTSANYNQGYDDGFVAAGTAGSNGFAVGFPAGYKAGVVTGNAAGNAAGQAAGYKVGYNQTYNIYYNIYYPIGYEDGVEDATIQCFEWGDEAKGITPPLATKHQKNSSTLQASVNTYHLTHPYPAVASSSSTAAPSITRINPVGPEPVYPPINPNPLPSPIRFPIIPSANLCSLITGCTVIPNGYTITDGEGGLITCVNGVCKDNNPTYNSGYTAGYNEGKAVSYGTGYELGYAAGNQAGQAYGYSQGYPIGYPIGLNNGEVAGSYAGADDGYNDGYWAGFYSVDCEF